MSEEAKPDLPLSSEDERELNHNQRLFIAEFLKDRNATQAAIRAGYSEHTANEQGSRLKNDPRIAKRIEEQLRAQAERLLLNADMVLLEMKRVAFADLREAYNEDGSLKTPSELPDDLAHALVGVEVDEIWEGFGQERTIIGQTKKVKLADKNVALTNLGKHFKLLTDKVEHDFSSGLGDLLREGRERAAKAQAEVKSEPEAGEKPAEDPNV